MNLETKQRMNESNYIQLFSLASSWTGQATTSHNAYKIQNGNMGIIVLKSPLVIVSCILPV